MAPKLSLAGINRLRGFIALVSGAIAGGLSYSAQTTTSGSDLTDQALLATLWIYVGATAVPWANLKGMAGSGVASTLTMGGFGVYLAGVTAFTGWSVAESPGLREPPHVERPARCVPDPVSADAGVPDAPAPSRDASAPALAPHAPEASPDAAVAADATPAVEAVDAATAPEERRRRRRRDGDDPRAPPAVWLERDPVRPAAPAP